MADLEYTVTNQGISTSKTSRLVSGTIGVYTVKFTFNNVWDGLEKWATFDPIPGTPYKQPLDANGECTIPGEVMGGVYLRIGVFGLAEGQAYPTIWASKLPLEEGCFVNVPPSDWPEPSPLLEDVVKVSEQTFTDTQKTQARTNIGAAGSAEMTTALAGKVDKPVGATEGNVAVIGSNGNISDSGISKDNLLIAPQLASNNIKTDSIPYLYRQTGGGIGVGNREYDSIVGGSIVNNQLLNNGDFSDSASSAWSGGTYSDGSYMLSAATATYAYALQTMTQKINSSHKYLFYAKAKVLSGFSTGINAFIVRIGGTSSGFNFAVLLNTTASDNTVIEYEQIRIPSSNSNNATTFRIGINSSDSASSAQIDEVMMIDLTQMFGSAVADRLYAMEQASAGSGIAVLHAMGLNQYRPYTAQPSLESVSGLQSHKTVGFNLCGSPLEFGNIDTSGNNSGSDKRYLRTSDYIKVEPNNTLCFYASTSQKVTQIYGICYDANKQFISRNSVVSGSTPEVTKFGTLSINANTHYVRMFAYNNGYFTTTDADFCISISDPARDGTYEPYEEHTYPLDSSLTLRGVAVIDDNNNIKFDGDEYAPDGTVTRKYGIVDLGTLTWTKLPYTGKAVFTATPINAKGYSGLDKILSTKYIPSSASRADTLEDLCLMIASTGGLYIRDDSYIDSTASAFKTAMSGIDLVYELATPTTETAEPYESLQICDPLGTEEYVTTGIVPVGHVTQYPENQVAKLDGIPRDVPSKQSIAYVQDDFTAIQPYVVNDLVYVGDTLYIVTSAIAQGATMTPNTNCSETTLNAVIKSLR